jgi:hypothetical protein
MLPSQVAHSLTIYSLCSVYVQWRTVKPVHPQRRINWRYTKVATIDGKDYRGKMRGNLQSSLRLDEDGKNLQKVDAERKGFRLNDQL